MLDLEEGRGSAIELPYLTATAALAAVAPAVGDDSTDMGRGVLFAAGKRACVISAENATSTITVRAPIAARSRGSADELRLLFDYPFLKGAIAAAVKGTHAQKRGPFVVALGLEPDGPLLTLNGWTVPVVGSELQLPADAQEPEEPLPVVADVACADFMAAVTRAAAATTTKVATMPHLRCVLVELTDGWITFAGSDRFRLAAERVRATCVGDARRLPLKVFVDGATLAAVAKQFAAERVTIGWAQGPMGVVLSFTCGDVSLRTRELKGTFFDVRGLVTAPGTARVRVDRGLLAQVAQCAAAFGSTEGRDVIVTFDRETVTVRPALRARLAAVSAPVLRAETRGLAGPLEVWFDGPRFAAAVEAVGTDKVVLYPAAGPTRTIVTADGDGSAVRCALSPRRSRQETTGAVASAA